MIKYAVIKLVTGEELFSQIEEFEEDKNSLILMDPCIIKELPQGRKGPFALYKIDTWLNLTSDHMFCLKMDHSTTTLKFKEIGAECKARVGIIDS